LDVTSDASGLDAKDLMADAKTCPFSSRPTRSLFGVEELKNLTQLALIAAMAAAEPPLADEPAVGGIAGADWADGLIEEGAMAEADDPGTDAELELPEQAASAVSVRPRAGARRIRRVW
jgi:hypothetical protein